MYSCIGWIIEVVYHIFILKKFINRGFLFGPICPIYGSGAVLMILFLTPLKNNLLYLFLGGIVVATILEYITGYVLELVFDTKWWDYSEEKFNIKGYVCLRFSLAWGIASVILMYVIHPIMEYVVYSIPASLLSPLYNILLIFFVIDLTLTINSLIEFRKVLKELVNIREELNKKIRSREGILKGRAETVYLKLKRRHIRLLKAYPHLTTGRLSHVIEEIKNKRDLIRKELHK
nr:putative ABC transporter permease [Tissierella simiarum]